jgi:hypothetical protein
MSRSMSASHPHTHDHPHDHSAHPAGERAPARVDTLLRSAGSRLFGVAVVSAAMWAALWLALRAG